MATAEQKQEGQHRDGSDFVITQTFDAPRELVFQSWVEPERLDDGGEHDGNGDHAPVQGGVL